jgi:hypothetical protein
MPADVVSFQEPAERLKMLGRHRQLLYVHWAIFIVSYPALLAFFLNEPGGNAFLTVILGFVLAHGAIGVVMSPPACFYGGYVYPEILLLEDRLVYVGGSVALRYPRLWTDLTMVKYLLGIEASHVIRRDDIVSVQVRKTRFLRPGMGRAFEPRRCILIRHRQGVIMTGMWLSEQRMVHIAGRLAAWHRDAHREIYPQFEIPFR